MKQMSDEEWLLRRKWRKRMLLIILIVGWSCFGLIWTNPRNMTIAIWFLMIANVFYLIGRLYYLIYDMVQYFKGKAVSNGMEPKYENFYR